MIAKKKSLQKFTESETKINKLMALDIITKEDLKALTEPELKQFSLLSTSHFNSLKGAERDSYFKKIEPVVDESTKNQLWESNHTKITVAISTLMMDYGRMPTKNEISIKTELSRQTIHKHLKEFQSHPQYLDNLEQFRIMSSKVLAKVFQFALNGDIAAAKLYFNMISRFGESPLSILSIKNQNNYIQFNSMVLSQETIKKLNSEQLEVIENVIRQILSPNQNT